MLWSICLMSIYPRAIIFCFKCCMTISASSLYGLIFIDASILSIKIIPKSHRTGRFYNLFVLIVTLRQQYMNWVEYTQAIFSVSPADKKGEGRSRIDRDTDNQQLMQLEEKDVVSSVATVLSDLCGPGEWMPMEKLHAEVSANCWLYYSACFGWFMYLTWDVYSCSLFWLLVSEVISLFPTFINMMHLSVINQCSRYLNL